MTQACPQTLGVQAAWNGLTLEQCRFAPGERDTPPRAEHLICLNLGERHELWLSSGGRTQRIVQGPGEMLLLPFGEARRAQHTAPAEVLHLLVQPEMVHRVAHEMGVSRTEMAARVEINDPRLWHLGLALREEAQTGGSGPLFAECLVTAVAAHLLARYSTAPLDAAVPGAHGLSASQLTCVTDYIRSSLAADLSLAEIAAVAHASPFHLARQFKRATGRTLHQFVVDCRIQAAKRLLRRSECSVSQVAGEVGFAQQSHLAAHFKRATGLSPLAFRRQFGTHESAQNAQEFD